MRNATCLAVFVCVCVAGTAIGLKECLPMREQMSKRDKVFSDLPSVKTKEDCLRTFGQPDSTMSRFNYTGELARVQWTYQGLVKLGDISYDVEYWWNPDDSFSSFTLRDPVTGEVLR